MTLLYLIAVIVLNFMGEPVHTVVDKLNATTGMDVHGVVYFFLGWLIMLLFDAIISNT
jgi:hypothetical protein